MVVAGLVHQVHVLLVVGVRLYREALVATLHEREGLAVVGAIGTSGDALSAVDRAKPDVVIIDVGIARALELMRELRARTAVTRIVAFAVDDDVSAILDCAEAGAQGFVTADASRDELLSVIERTLAGELLCSPRMAAELLSRAVGRSTSSRPPAQEAAVTGLTNREHQVLVLLRRGMANKEIASALCIAEATVKNHVHHLLEKLKLTSRWQAAAQADPVELARMSMTAPARSDGLHRRSRPSESPELSPEQASELNPN